MKAHYEFHEACRKGDVERVRQLLPTMTYTQINRRGQDGNTPLQSACANNHGDIVNLLFDERDICSRTLRNRDGKTAYDCTTSNEIKKLFSRSRESSNNRFVENNARIILQPISCAIAEEKVSNKKIPDDWMCSYTNVKNTFDGQFMLALQNAPLPLKTLLKLRTENEARDIFENLLERCIERAPTKREMLLEEYKNYKKTKKNRILANNLHI